MRSPLLIVDAGGVPQRADADSFVNLGIWERRHIQEWVRRLPDILGEKLLIVVTEFDRFTGSEDRLDILAVDCQGNLVVVEFKRDTHAGYADLQAIRYAAMVAGLTVEKLIPLFADYIAKAEGADVGTQDEARRRLVDFITDADFTEFSNKPRIMLCSQDFSQELTTSVLWLIQNFGLDISCVRLTPYRVGDQTIVVPARIIPLDEARQYTIDVREKEVAKAASADERKRKAETLPMLIRAGVLKEGDRLYFQYPDIPYSAEDSRCHALVTGKLGQSNQVQWEHDQVEYSITGLTHQAIRAIRPDKEPRSVNGNSYWTTDGGLTLWALGEKHRQSLTEPISGS